MHVRETRSTEGLVRRKQQCKVVPTHIFWTSERVEATPPGMNPETLQPKKLSVRAFRSLLLKKNLNRSGS